MSRGYIGMGPKTGVPWLTRENEQNRLPGEVNLPLEWGSEFCRTKNRT